MSVCERTARLKLNRCGLGIGVPFSGDTRPEFVKMNSEQATPAANVTTASWAPRMRRAGIPTITPTRVAPRQARIGDMGNGIPRLEANFDRAKPAVPANAI